jgi:valyl-tRNA synthetase
MEKVYSFKDVEPRWYAYWEQHKLFSGNADPRKKPYTIVIPPPNVTGKLTIGHVLNNTLQDILIRWKRMQGFEALWIPGTDHAAIATHNAVEKALMREEKKTRHDIGREAFITKVEAWVKQYGGTIIGQLKRLGCSCDWERTAYTMDEVRTDAVTECFVRLHEQGLIYRGKYLINWCPRCTTALSDEESVHQDENGKLWYFKYPVKGTDTFVTVATTRPETMLGDTAVAVNPKDERYQSLVGAMLALPLTNREIPVIADDMVDPAFGTGAVKVTPAHDPNDFATGRRHQLAQINILNDNATLNDNVPSAYRGLDRYQARKKVVADLEVLGLVEKIEDHAHAVSHCQRCDTVVEPYLSDQWFVKMKPLAEPAVKVVHDKQLTFYPDRWTGVYLHWMENIKDWCISRQLWWGHRIPAYHCEACGTITVARENPEQCPKCLSKKLRQDPDVLDTWFSSWLWPLSTLGWPRDNKDLDYFYPTTTLVTGPDIIPFWVARMVMAGYAFKGKCPFTDVYLTSMVRDMQGRKMSKSLGNSPDPTDLMDTYGADALRMTMTLLETLGQDIHFSNEKCEVGRNFANKLWNASRFVVSNLEGLAAVPPLQEDGRELADRWIVSRLHHTICAVNETLEKRRFSEAAHDVYEFIWHDFCDWYIELAKQRLYKGTDAEKAQVQAMLVHVLAASLRMLHPFMPYITEEIWEKLPVVEGKPQSIMQAPWPPADPAQVDEAIERDMQFIQTVITAIRTMRAEASIAPGKETTIMLRPSDQPGVDALTRYTPYLRQLLKIQDLSIGTDVAKPQNALAGLAGSVEIFIPMEGLIDLDKEKARIQDEMKKLAGYIEGTEKKLANESFVQRAPKAVVDKEREKVAGYKEQLRKLEENLRTMK